jgi:hypothetical protein
MPEGETETGVEDSLGKRKALRVVRATPTLAGVG